MKAERLNALIALLDDPEEAVFKMVEKEFLKGDTSVINQLEKVWESSFDRMVQIRIENIIDDILFKDTSRKIKDWSGQENGDLFEGFFLVGQIQYPEIKQKQIKSRIRKISNDVWLEINNRLTSIEKITVLNHIFYDIHRFTVNPRDIDIKSTSCCFVNRILDTKRANPVSIAILYTLVARELDFPVQLIDFPKNPLLAYIDPYMAKKAHGPLYGSSVLFYINPSNKGAIIGRKEIEFFMRNTSKRDQSPNLSETVPNVGNLREAKNNEPIDEDIFDKYCEDRSIIKKLIECLIEGYDSIGFFEKAEGLISIAEML